MVRVADHPGVAGLRAGWRAGRDAMPARHIRVIRLLAGGAELRRGGAAERLRAGASLEEPVERCNRFGPSSPGARRRGNGARPTLLTPEVLAMLRERAKTPPDDAGVWTARKVAAAMAGEAGLASVAPARAAGRRCAPSAGPFSALGPAMCGRTAPGEQAAFRKTRRNRRRGGRAPPRGGRRPPDLAPPPRSASG